MPLDTLFALLAFAAIASGTPGPNTLMLLASGVNFGFRMTVPHMVGIALGFGVLLSCVGLGLGSVLAAYPVLNTALKIGGATYLLYLAWRIAGSRALGPDQNAAKPLSVLAAAGFQWVNPKAWMMGVTAMAVYVDPAEPYTTALIVVSAFLVVAFPLMSLWTGFGTLLRGFLSDPARLKWFNITMGLLLALTVVPMVM